MNDKELDKAMNSFGEDLKKIFDKGSDTESVDCTITGSYNAESKKLEISIKVAREETIKYVSP